MKNLIKQTTKLVLVTRCILNKQTRSHLSNFGSMGTVGYFLGLAYPKPFSTVSSTLGFPKPDSSISSPTMSPWFLTGFADAEGSFSILIQHNKKFKTN